jgi:hypothetical protein
MTTRRARAAYSAVVAIGIGMIASACGGVSTATQNGPLATPTAKPTPTADLPGEANKIPAGTYRTHDFEPRMLLTLPDRVWGNDEDLPQFLVLYSQGTDAEKINRCTLLFLSPTQVFDPNATGKLDTVPADLIARLQSHPYLTTHADGSTKVGGLDGVQLSFSVTAGKPFPDYAFGRSTKFLFPPGPGGDRVPPFGVVAGESGTMIVLQVSGRPVVVVPEGPHPGCDFTTFGPQQQALLTTLRFAS